MGNYCDFSSLKQSKLEISQRQLKQVSNAPTSRYALRMKNIFPLLPTHVEQLRKKMKITQVEEIIKDCPIYFIYQKSAVYQGHWKQGQPHGYGRILYKDFSYYEGLIVQGEPNTFITASHREDSFYIFADGSYYRGEFKDAKFQGRGALVTKNNSVRIIGQFRQGLPHGKATQTFLDYNERYQGEYVNGMKSGKGQYYVDDLLVYEGNFLNGNMHGQGRMIDYNGSEFLGQFQNGKKMVGNLRSIHGNVRSNEHLGSESGQGYYQWQDGKFYIGGFKNNKFQGKGKIYFPNGRVAEGMWQKGHNKRIKKVTTIKEQQVKRIRVEYKKASAGLQHLEEQKLKLSESSLRIDGFNSEKSNQQEQYEDETRKVVQLN